ncbi:MAG: hypothetical protein SPL39_05045 [Selenomonadaceae bacterium]|nr:hypothetical protein [Selenomonadaceae bacterium]
MERIIRIPCEVQVILRDDKKNAVPAGQEDPAGTAFVVASLAAVPAKQQLLIVPQNGGWYNESVRT